MRTLKRLLLADPRPILQLHLLLHAGDLFEHGAIISPHRCHPAGGVDDLPCWIVVEWVQANQITVKTILESWERLEAAIERARSLQIPSGFVK